MSACVALRGPAGAGINVGRSSRTGQEAGTNLAKRALADTAEKDEVKEVDVAIEVYRLLQTNSGKSVLGSSGRSMEKRGPLVDSILRP